MSNEILSVLEYMEKEKGISREDMIVVITDAIHAAALKGVNAGQDLKIEINPRTGALAAWTLTDVVDSVSDPSHEIHIENARKIDPEAQVGTPLAQALDPSYLGRIAAQAARQGIMQRVRQFEKERIYEDYKSSIGDVMSGTVRRRERGDLIVDLGKAEAKLPNSERIPGEDYSAGDRIRCLLLKIETTPRGPELILSRSHIDFVRRLVELEVNEIVDGTVNINDMAREPGYRTKITVTSTDPKVDPVGACVGARGARVKSIVRELAGEKIDVIHHYDDPVKMLQEALKPAVALKIELDEQPHRIYIQLRDDDMSAVIGRKGQNARLTSKLLGWQLDISKEKKETVNFEQRMRRAVEGLHLIDGLDDAMAEKLVALGINSPEAFEGVIASDLVDAGFSSDEAEEILGLVQTYRESQG